eukprot:11103606-Alexandrium_andersonii.AAC.1
MEDDRSIGPRLMDFGKMAVGAMRHFGFRPKNGKPMPAVTRNENAGKLDSHAPKRKRNDGGMGLACDTSSWFNLEEFFASFSYWRSARDRPLGT